MSRHLLYFADPMCSWCWGFSPVIGRLREAHGADMDIRLVMGGLRPGTVAAMSDRDKDYVREHWQHVEAASGQPFAFAFFAREGFVYDTEPASRACVAARRLGGGAELALLALLHKAFYADNRDVTDDDVLADVAGEAGVAEADFRAAFAAPETAHETQADFWYSQSSGITGFPTLLAVAEGKAAIVTVGYRPWEAVGPGVAQWLAADDA